MYLLFPPKKGGRQVFSVLTGSPVGCRMPDAGCRMPDAGCRMPDAGCRMPDAGCRMPDASMSGGHPLLSPVGTSADGIPAAF